MKEYKCIIVEDEKLAVNLLQSHISKIPYLNCIGVFTNVMNVYSFLSDNEVDILFLDIEMPRMKGIDFVKTLNNKYKVIFTTAYEEYAVEAFAQSATDYLLKPIEFPRFMQAVNRATSQTVCKSIDKEKSNIDKLFVKVDSQIVNIPIESIRYIQGMQKYVNIITEKNKYTTLLSMSKLMESLPNESFFRVHKSYIVNVNNITSIEGNYIKFDKDVIPIAKGQRKSFIDGIKQNSNILNF